MMDVRAVQLCFLDESIFKEQTGWRGMGYAPIGEPLRWSEDMRRGDTWSILAAYTTVRSGYINGNTRNMLYLLGYI